MPTILEVENLYKHYASVKAVDGISFAINEGECFGLLGPNGAGKTTTLEIIEGICPPDSGKILYRNQANNPQLAHEAGIQFQSTALPDYLTSRDVLKLFQQFYSTALGIDELVSLCELHEFIDQTSTRLSGGQRQRLLLAIALVNDPRILFLDEPTTGLDPQSRHHFWRLVNRVKSQGKTIILTTHYMDEAEKLCDTLVIMDHGHIIAEGAPQALLAEHFQYSKIRINGIDIDAPELSDLTEEVAANNGGVEILSGNVDQTLQNLLQQQVHMGSLTVSSPTLEDLFIKLTGHSLRG